MSESQQRQSETNNQRLTLPAIGYIATDENSDALVRSIVRAQQHGHGTIVTYDNGQPPEGIAYANQLNATVVEPPSSDPDQEMLREGLTMTAAGLGYPGLIMSDEDCQRIDFEASRSNLSIDQFKTDAVLEGGDATSSSTLIAIPAYNEADSIGDVVKVANTVADIVVVVDDGSHDDTAQVARDAGAYVIEHDENLGYGAALKTAFEEGARRNVGHLVTLDADGQHDPREVAQIIDHQRKTGAALVVGNRFADEVETDMPLYRRVGLGTINALTNVSLGSFRPSSWVKDTQNGFRAYDAELLESLASDATIGDRMNASVDILYHTRDQGFSIEEVPLTVNYDVDDANSLNPITHGGMILNNIFRMVERRRPILSLGFPGVSSMVIGIGIGYLTILNYVDTGTFSVGGAILSSFLGIVGMLSCLTAIILHALSVSSK